MKISLRFALLLLLSLSVATAQTVHLSEYQAEEIAKRIWKNECAGTVNGLTSWNSGEYFASLGIGHFIWYADGHRGPFEESFPKLVAFLTSQGIAVPDWTHGSCPWATRAEFLAAFQSPEMKELRTMLAATVAEQAQFAALRMEEALPKILAAAPAGEREQIKTNFYRVAAAPLGAYALMDYVNFKGEGTSPTERYNDQGWGLLQALEMMSPSGPAVPAFADAADKVLTRRVKNAPPERNEAQWLPGWRNRLATYTTK